MKTVVLVFGSFNQPRNLKPAYKLGVIYSFVYSKTIYKKHNLRPDLLLDSRFRINNSKQDGYSYNSLFLKDIKQLERFLQSKTDVIIYIPELEILLQEIIDLAFYKGIEIVYGLHQKEVKT